MSNIFDNGGAHMDLTYREKRIWINLVTQLIVYAVYYYELWRGNVTIGSLIVVVVAIIVLQIILHIVLAMTDRPYPKDERDIAIERSAYRNAYFVLAGALFCAMTLLAVHALNPELRREFGPGPFHIINALLFMLLLASCSHSWCCTEGPHEDGGRKDGKEATHQQPDPRPARRDRDDAAGPRGQDRSDAADGERDRGRQVLAVAGDGVSDCGGVRGSAGAGVSVGVGGWTIGGSGRASLDDPPIAKDRDAMDGAPGTLRSHSCDETAWMGHPAPGKTQIPYGSAKQRCTPLPPPRILGGSRMDSAL